MPNTDATRRVRAYTGKRKDQTSYHGLWFEGPKHKNFFLTPGQFRTVKLLSDEAEEILKSLPGREPRKGSK